MTANPLGKEEAEELLTFLLGRDTTLTLLKQRILDETQGTPFFMEEIVQTLIEEGALIGEKGNYRLDRAPSELHIPPTVQGVLAARIDRLPAAEKALLQQLAVIGREFPLRLIRKVITESEEELYRLLSALQAREFLYEQPAFPEAEYVFKHALTQDVVYSSVLQERRMVLHERTAQAMEGLYRASLEEHYSELAHHYSRTRNTPKAVQYLGPAGQQAIEQSANEDARQYLTQGLKLLESLPDGDEHLQQELDLQANLGVALARLKGYSAQEVGTVYTRARELCLRVF